MTDKTMTPIEALQAICDAHKFNIASLPPHQVHEIAQSAITRHLSQPAERGEAVAFIITDAKGKKFTIYNQLLAEAMRHIAKGKGSTLRVDAVCTIPDFGWFCTRGEGHDGPCAAWPNSPTETCPTCGGPATRHEVSGPFEMRDEYRTAPPPAAGAPDVAALSLELEGVIADVELLHRPFDDTCLQTIKRVSAILSATPSPTIDVAAVREVIYSLSAAPYQTAREQADKLARAIGDAK